MQPVTVIIPCYNEAARLQLNDFRSFLSSEPIHFIFVNDGSTDDTLSLIEKLKSEYPLQVQILNVTNNSGKAAAVRIGMLNASLQVDTDIIGFMDADLSTPLEEIIHFEDTFRKRKVEMVFGSRISRIGSKIQRFNYRHYFGRIVATAISIYLKIPIYDSQCGAKFFKTQLAKEVFLEPFISPWLFDVEIFKRIQITGRNIDSSCWELPLDEWIEKGGSKLKVTDLLKLPFEFFRIIKHYRSKDYSTIKEALSNAKKTSKSFTPSQKDFLHSKTFK
jgi:glycosyltransferase involved in cell wall biosynthesis